MHKSFLALCALAVTVQGFGAAQATVHVEPTNLDGPRQLQEQTATGVVRDYMQAWQSLSAALEQNSADLLNADFVGTAKDKLAETIHAEAALDIRTRYQDRAHDVQIVFYSPEGLSIELIDTVDYDVQVFDHDKQVTTQQVRQRYIVVMTPAEVRWRVRVMQTAGE